MTNEPLFAKRINRLTGSVAREILSRTNDKDIISFAGGLPDPDLWNNIEIPSPDKSSFQYGPSEGDQNIREVFSNRMQQCGIKTTWQKTLVLSGSQQGLDLVSKLFLTPGRVVLVEEPTYLAALQVFNLFEAQIIGIPMDKEGMNPAALIRAIETHNPTLLYINPTFQNPSGLNYSAERRIEIANILKSSDIVVLEDDPYRDLSYKESETNTPITSHLHKNWIYMSSVSKLLMPGLRLGYLTCSNNLFDPLLKLKQAADLHTNRISQSIAYQMLTSKAFIKDHTKTVTSHYRNKRDIMLNALSESLSDLAEWAVPNGGMFIWLHLKKQHNLRQVLNQCLEQGVAIMPGDAFFPDQSKHGYYIRLNFTNPPSAHIKKGIEQLARSLKTAP